MALIDIARQLKKTFDGFETYGFDEQLEEIRKIYKDAELIRIGETDYIVINDEYKMQENARFSASPLFRGITEPSCAIIDIKTAPTLIEEVYARVTYMRKTFRTDGVPNASDIMNSLSELYGGDLRLEDERNPENSFIIADDGISKANIFECRLEKDTGVSAATDTYSFMISGDEVKDIDKSVISEIKSSGEVEFLKDRNAINNNYGAIQDAVFKKYVESDIVQSIKVKSIFEIALASRNVLVRFTDMRGGKTAVFKTTHIPAKQNEFDKLNASIHVCNSCRRNLVDVDSGVKHKLHLNTDALAEVPRTANPKDFVYAVGCEECLEQCPECGEWHFNYKKLKDKSVYNNVIFAPGRDFVKGIGRIDGNFCSCRSNIEWVYDERTGTEGKNNIIPIQKMAFVNYANECIGTYAEWKEYYERHTRGKKAKGREETKTATALLDRFKKQLAARNEIDEKDVIITSVENCRTCSVCGGKYVPETYMLGDYRCPTCDLLVSEKLHMVTRVDGVIFMRKEVKGKVGRRDVVTKYVMNKLGNLRRVKHNVSADADGE